MKITLALVLMGTALSLSAQDVRFGVQGALSLPGTDLSDNADAGLQIGGHARWSFARGSGVIARVDATFYGQNDGTNVSDLAFGADYTYHFSGRQTGPYVLAGLSQHNFNTSVSGHSWNNNGLGLDLGGGYDLDRNLGLQARYTTTSFDGMTYSAMNLGATYTF